MDNFDLRSYLSKNPLKGQVSRGRKRNLLENRQSGINLPKVLITLLADAHSQEYTCIWKDITTIEDARVWIQDLVGKYVERNFDAGDPNYFEEWSGVEEGANYLPDYPGDSLSGGFDEETGFDLYLVETPEQLDVLANKYGEEIKNKKIIGSPEYIKMLPSGILEVKKTLESDESKINPSRVPGEITEDHYVEEMDDSIVTHVQEIVFIFNDWKEGVTDPKVIQSGKDDLIRFITEAIREAV